MVVSVFFEPNKDSHVNHPEATHSSSVVQSFVLELYSFGALHFASQGHSRDCTCEKNLDLGSVHKALLYCEHTLLS